MENLDLKTSEEEKFAEHEIDKQIADVLLGIGISANLQGYHFLKEAIKVSILSPAFINSITKLLYPEVARRYKSTAGRVERAIRHAIEVSYNKGRIIYLNKLFDLQIFEEKDKPSNGEFIALVADRLALQIYGHVIL